MNGDGRCDRCNKFINRYPRRRDKKVYCDKCFMIIRDEGFKKEFEEDIDKQNKVLRRFERTREFLVKKFKTLDEYEPALEMICKLAYKPKWFQSMEEILVAIELLRNKVKTKHQVSYGPYKVDFVLPDFKILLEIDGAFHNKERDRERDKYIKSILEPDWCIIRFKADDISKNLKMLFPSILRAAKRKREYERINKVVDKFDREKNMRFSGHI